MGKIKESLAIKTAAFAIVVICSMVAAISVTIVVINAEYQWYSKAEETVQEDIYKEVASKAHQLILDELYTNYYETDANIEAPLIEDENSSTQFGYKITLINDAFPWHFVNGGIDSNSRIVNEGFIYSDDVLNQYDFMHGDTDIIIYLGKISENSVPGELYNLYRILDFTYDYNRAAAAVTLLSIIVIVALVIFFFVSAGRKEKMSRTLAKMPIEICMAIFIAGIIMLAAISKAILEEFILDLIILMIIVDAAAVASMIMAFLLILIIKVRHNNLWESSICYKLYKGTAFLIKKSVFICSSIIKAIPLVWKSALVVLAGIMINLFITTQICAYSGYNGGFWFIWLVGAAIIEGVCIYIAWCMRKLKIAGEHLAVGDLDYKIDEKGLFLDFKDHAHNLGSIGDGMSRAVEEKMKSEKFKTELITNVSHDIKTPLTSIINYVDLLSAEEIENENAREYVDVIERQAQRLKKLTDDLVEASKAASGTVKLDLIPCKAAVLMSQAAGEYDSKMKEKNLELITGQMEDEIEIIVDGRSMWRIFDNLLNNICKYSQPGTRVYQSLENRDGMAIITYKNTSEYQLNITEEELMERFVRGDRSRHTDGSGLGLSIAKNLTELQGGSFKVNIDGDLFKVMVEFPIYR